MIYLGLIQVILHSNPCIYSICGVGLYEGEGIEVRSFADTPVVLSMNILNSNIYLNIKNKNKFNAEN